MEKLIFTFSVIVTCYNEGEKLYSAINSVKNQTKKDFELIIVNDSSPDQLTNEICQQLSENGEIVLKTNYNVGPSGARNLGISKAKGDVIIPIDADDELPTDAVELICNAFENGKMDFVYGNYLVREVEVGNEFIVDCSKITNSYNRLDPKKLMQNWILLGMSPFKKKLWSMITGYSMEFSFTCQDVDFQMRSLSSGAEAGYINQLIYIYNKSAAGINSRDINYKAMNKCYYNNYDFILHNSIKNNLPFEIALEFKDYNKLKSWSRCDNTANLNNKKRILVYHTPIFLLSFLRNVFYTYRWLKNKKIFKVINNIFNPKSNGPTFK